MHLRGLDLNLLVALDVLLDEQSITQAAKRLNMSQSGMSTALLRLREFFGDDLLVALGRRMTLTPLAQTLVEPVRAIVLQAQTLVDATPGFNPATATRRFKIMASDYIATVFLPRVTERVASEAPGVVLEIVPFSPLPHEPLGRGEIDFLIFPEHFLTDEHPSVRLFTEQYVCVSWRENRHIAGELSFDAYMSLGHIVSNFGFAQGMAFDQWFVERFDRHRRIENLVMNFATMPHCVVGTQRIATMHERMARIYAQFLPLRIHRLPFEMPKITEALQWNRFSTRHPAFIWLRTVIGELAAEFASQRAD